MAEFGRVLFMRHPETEGNLRRILSGQAEIGLTEPGRAQAARAARALAAWGPDRIVCSPLSRCHAIADVAARELGLTVVDDERLVEIGFGSLEGTPLAELERRGTPFPWAVEGGKSRPAGDAESFESLIGRARDFVAWVCAQPGTTACVTHGGFIRAVSAAVYDEPTERFWERDIANVSSHLYSSNGRRLALLAAGLTPEELIGRAQAAADAPACEEAHWKEGKRA